MDNSPTSEVLAMNEITFKGNVIPHSWYKHLRYESGKANLNAIIILSEIAYWYRPSEVRDEETGQLLGYKKKFRADKLQRSHKSFSDQFGLTKKQVRDALEFLKDKDLITKELRTITTAESILSNVLFIGINPVNIKAISLEVIPPMTFKSHPPDIEVTSSILESQTYTESTTESTTESLKASSASADYSLPVSLLSESEIKGLKLPLSAWTQYLEDEQAERSRSGVIKFVKAKLAIYPLLPDSPAATILFDKLTIEAEAKGRRPPNKFPTLAAKEKFNLAAGNLNGTLETAINSGLAAGITAIPKLINYISSPKWRENNGQAGTRTGQQSTNSNQRGQGQPNKFAPAPGAGQSPEMAAKLRAAHAPK